MEQMTEKWKRDRKFYTIMPLLVFPFLTMGFWALGGGKGTENLGKEELEIGFNTELPKVAGDALLETGKLAYYEKAAQDSLKRMEQIKNDPYRKMAFMVPDEQDSEYGNPDKKSSIGAKAGIYTGPSEIDPNEALVMEKLKQLNEVLEKESVMEAPKEKEYFKPEPFSIDHDLDRLEQMMSMMNRGNQGEDPEMKEIKDILENILDIQHPERVAQRISETRESNMKNIHTVMKDQDEGVFSGLSKTFPDNHRIPFEGVNQNGFYSMENDGTDPMDVNSIRAVIHETQTLVSGTTVKVRLLEKVRIDGMLIPKDHFVYGTASLNGERLKINIQNIRMGEYIMPVSLNLFDADGLEGIYVPGAISRDAVKQSGDQAIQGFGFNTFNPTLEAQAASAGIETARNLLSKKMKLIKVTVKAGYQVWLLDEKQHGKH
ncbi:Bacteroides conjugative transposon TraM protein [Aquiflexum balticum DSM 16537]|uniref:Bacteroides conjugative transposon TraM protein n=1 Tax=Aquiflexum balticum DSM 16537 TaxID=758820 RepID=A0A1W2H7U1_9BACT|nr:conjugative transposon protein TraM [Aquiflexum balticum]SMD44909.1 Bacteroides conjugative transposon TraM protein [Aquiflexum balticum DSM 16537]